MNPPFTTAEFLGVFGRYNQGVWPAQVLFYVLAAAVLYLAWRPRSRSDLVIGGALAWGLWPAGTTRVRPGPGLARRIT
jgi:hypothetical protein